MLTPEELRQIRRLAVQAGRRVDSLFAGGYRSAFRGRGMEFEEVRPYVPGDDVRHIDWNVTARAEEAYVKEFREERELTLVLAVDLSGSVAFGSGGRDGRTDKRLQIARIAGGLSYAAVRSNDRVGLVAFTDRVEVSLPPSRSRGHVWQVIREVYNHKPQGRGTDLAVVVDHLGKVLRRRAVVCVISDFVYPADLTVAPSRAGRPADLGRQLRSLGSRHRLNALLVHDPLEAALPPVGLVELIDGETGRVQLVDASRVRPAWSVDQRLEALRRGGALATAISTHEDPFPALIGHFRRMGARR